MTDLPVFAGENWKIHAHPFGTDVAFKCAECDHPVLATTAFKSHPGKSENSPTACENCGAKYFAEIFEGEKVLIHAILPKK
ncbi:MAG: hypothetical protein MPK09_00680 [Gammaproteobacteria bacterium]|nr:hypothetical protein [Gammaproteobacteria bacterium]